MWYKPLECDAIVLATNAHAAAALLGKIQLGDPSRDRRVATDSSEKETSRRVERLRSTAARTKGAACWSLTVAFDAPLRLKYDALKLRAPFETPVVFVANESSKPGRGAAASAGWGYRWAEVGRVPVTGAGECWVAHASPEWSAEHRELAPSAAAEKLCAAFLSLVERDGAGDPEPVHCKATRWRFAFPLAPDEAEKMRETERLKAPYLFDPSLMLGACGDWTSGPGAGDAYESGAALGAAVAKRFAASRAAEEAA